VAGEGGKKSDPTVPIIIGILALLFLVFFGGCGQISLPVYRGGNTYNGSHGSHYSGGCDRGRDCRGRDDDDRRGSGHERRHRRGTEDPDSTPTPRP
jgi:hypothetical protein